jgi:hypothetical protein
MLSDEKEPLPLCAREFVDVWAICDSFSTSFAGNQKIGRISTIPKDIACPINLHEWSADRIRPTGLTN